jgi:hypothetical protein
MKFQVGKSYFTRSIGDHDCVFQFQVLSRTAKTIKINDLHGNGLKTLRISLWEGVEQVKPLGSYSMAPIISADREVSNGFSI